MATKDLKSVGLDISGKVAIVTGAGRGIGKAMAITLARAGAKVCLVSRTLRETGAVRDEIIAEGGEAIAVSCDASNREQVDACVETCIKELGVPFILVLNQGRSGKVPTMSISQEEWDDLFAVNVRGHFNFVQAAGKHMLEREPVGRVRGKVIITSSITGMRGGRGGYLHYQSSKGALIAMTKALAMEWAKHDITVNGIAPGTFSTAMSTWKNLPVEDQKKFLASHIPMHWASVTPPAPDNAEDFDTIGTLTLYFASPASDYTTGQVVAIDGGSTEQT